MSRLQPSLGLAGERAAVRDLGTALGGEVLARALSVSWLPPSADRAEPAPVLGATTRTFEAPLQPLPSLGEVEAMLAVLDKEAEEHALRGVSNQVRVNSRRLRHWPEAMIALLRDGSGPFAEAFPAAREPSARASLTLPFEVHALRLGPLAIVGLPVEPLGAIGHALRDLAPGRVPSPQPANASGAMSGASAASAADAWVWCAGYANGCYGYLPPAHEYPRGGYEIDSAYRYYGQIAPFAPGCAALVLGAAAAALKTLFG